MPRVRRQTHTWARLSAPFSCSDSVGNVEVSGTPYSCTSLLNMAIRSRSRMIRIASILGTWNVLSLQLIFPGISLSISLHQAHVRHRSPTIHQLKYSLDIVQSVYGQQLTVAWLHACLHWWIPFSVYNEKWDGGCGQDVIGPKSRGLKEQVPKQGPAVENALVLPPQVFQ